MPRLPRIVLDDVRPRTPSAASPAKAVVGEHVRVSADIFKDGHDILGARVRWHPVDKPAWDEVVLHPLENDRWEAVIEPTTLGSHEFVIEAWTDLWATWLHKATVKADAGQEIDVELEEGALLLERRAKKAGEPGADQLRHVATRLRDGQLAAGLEAEIAALMEGPLDDKDVTQSRPYPLWVDRERALVGSWYELFPRSYGGLRGTAERVPAVARMGFDVLYLPPIHPIGTTFRKGRNNTLDPAPDDPGSPWAIGSPDGGHTAIAPELGTFEDFDDLVRVAHYNGIEIALDYALQCSPDHPWVTEHPEWFHHRPDGSIAYAENPPKKYQDIYPINFWPAKEKDRVALWEACREIFFFWIGHGVRIFRVDNPHTKPMAFWAWVLPEVQREHPDVIFLAEAFTRPKVMAKLAEVGFSQSYTYFTWRTEKWELEEYLEEIAHGPKADYMRPNFWPNTPDILSGPLRDGPMTVFKIRLVLAALLVPSYGIYSGYELGENEPASETNEEYLSSEKYEIKKRDWGDPGSIAPFIAGVNAIRKRHPALQCLRNIALERTDNDQVMAWSKCSEDGRDIVLVVVNLDPRNVQECTLFLDLDRLGLPWDSIYEAYDELTAQTFEWWGPDHYIRLDPLAEPAHVLHLRAPHVIDDDPRWYQKAVFYEVLTRGFYDNNDDGTGDLRGLTAKLDYLQWLGVDCLWLLPFYQSPLRDGGYDISDFFTVLPEYGDLADAVQLVEEAHRRGLRVIADLVMNHTSDQHPWFQESRQDKTNPKADWYVWNDDDHRWGEARIIFVDTEKSNWTWDPQREQYYWHRFFSHQPDLNFDNPEVQQAMLDVVRFWLDIGLDGFRLDAVPYLFERDGTNGENLPETHEYLRQVRKEVDATFPGRVLLAEANQWPADVVDYFGDGDECHMCFHFPLMPRMFMAIRREQRFPITEIMAQTPDIPDGAQWGIFLRNHDELTLEMVTDEERDYMYSEYAKDPRMKVNIGIRRRLAPLVENDRRVAELLHALLFSMPGSPVLYYGDEILMGDNIYLGDRDSVRTPMQWSPDRNAGFSRADFARLYLPPLMDPVYGYQAVNVEGALRDTSSSLHWMKRMLEIRKQHPLFGTGSLEFLSAENPSVLAYVREEGDDVVLCVNNLSRFAQPVELAMQRWEGKTPIELMGRVPFPRIGELPYFVTLGPYAFYWFQLVDLPAAEKP